MRELKGLVLAVVVVKCDAGAFESVRVHVPTQRIGVTVVDSTQRRILDGARFSQAPWVLDHRSAAFGQPTEVRSTDGHALLALWASEEIARLEDPSVEFFDKIYSGFVPRSFSGLRCGHSRRGCSRGTRWPAGCAPTRLALLARRDRRSAAATQHDEHASRRMSPTRPEVCSSHLEERNRALWLGRGNRGRELRFPSLLTQPWSPRLFAAMCRRPATHLLARDEDLPRATRVFSCAPFCSRTTRIRGKHKVPVQVSPKSSRATTVFSSDSRRCFPNHVCRRRLAREPGVSRTPAPKPRLRASVDTCHTVTRHAKFADMGTSDIPTRVVASAREAAIKAGVDITLLERNLREPAAQRVQRLDALRRFRERVQARSVAPQVRDALNRQRLQEKVAALGFSASDLPCSWPPDGD